MFLFDRRVQSIIITQLCFDRRGHYQTTHKGVNMTDAHAHVEKQAEAFKSVVESVRKRADEFAIEEVILRYAREQDLPVDVARQHASELKRFLALHAINPQKNYGMRGPIDSFWHTFLLFTKTYADFCQKIAGRFIHHVPRSEQVYGPPGTPGDYETFLADYEATFGHPAPPEIWPRPVQPEGGTSPNFCTSCGGCGSCGGVRCVVY
jgi:hypothetical protein